jgi:hypothetical protein
MHRGPRQQRRIDLERRVLGGRADEGEQARLDMRQEGVLLGLVEAVHLVDEDHRARGPRRRFALGLLDGLADVLHAGQHRRQHDELRVHAPAATSRASVVLPTPGGPHRIIECRRPDLERHAQRPPGAQQVLLADHLVQLRPQALGQRHRPGAAAGFAPGAGANSESCAAITPHCGSGPESAVQEGGAGHERRTAAAPGLIHVARLRARRSRCHTQAPRTRHDLAGDADAATLHQPGRSQDRRRTPAPREVPVVQARCRGVRHRHPEGAGDPRLRAPTRIANAPGFIKGVVNLRGVIVPIVDMRMRFMLDDVQYNASPCHHPEHRRSHRRHGGRLGQRRAGTAADQIKPRPNSTAPWMPPTSPAWAR